MKRWAVVAVLLLALLAGGGWWFWSLAAVPEEAAPNVTLKIDRQPVTVRQPNGTVYEEATSGMVVTNGWTVKTGEGGQATLSFFRQAESRIDSNSEVTIGSASQDANDPTKTSVRLDLEVGRLWSRVLRLFDLDSNYSVKTSSVVATVRGTTFDVRANANKTAEVWVSESVVTVDPTSGLDLSTTTTRTETSYDAFVGRAVRATTTGALAEGFSGMFDKNGRRTEVKELSTETKTGRWFMTNTLNDLAFLRAERDARRDELKKLGGTRPDSPLDGLSQLSERLHLTFADDANKDRLAERYLARRLAHLIELAETGKAGLATQEFARLENQVKTKLRGSENARERKRIKVALSRVSLLVEDAAPSSTLYPLKQRIEDLASSLVEEDPSALLFTRLLAVDSRIDEASKLLDDNMLEEARTALDAAKAGVENVERDATPVLPDLNDARRTSLGGKIFALKVREEAVRARFRASLQGPAPVPAATSTEPVVATSTTPTTPTTPKPPTTPPPTTPPPTPPPMTPPGTPVYTSISVFIQPNPINVGQTANLTVLATKATGGQDNITAKTAFKLVNGQGGLNGPVFTGTVAGTARIQADYMDNGTNRTAQVSIQVNGVAVLQSLVLSSSNGTTLTRNSPSTQIQAYARYSDGYQKLVSNLSTFTNSNPSAGTLSGTNFTGNFSFTYGGPFYADIGGSFTENGKTVTGVITLTIQ